MKRYSSPPGAYSRIKYTLASSWKYPYMRRILGCLKLKIQIYEMLTEYKSNSLVVKKNK